MIVPGCPLAFTLALIGQSGWSATLGTEQLAYRDISRSGPPADASPVKWEGSGPSLALVHERAGRRLHRFTLEIASAGGFSLAGPAQTLPASSGDRAHRLETRYEFRMYPFRNVLVRGLDAGVGVESIAGRLSLTRHTTAGVNRYVGSGVGTSCVAALRLHRWERWSGEIAWINGLRVLRQHDTFSVDSAARATAWGGGWLTDLSISGAVRVSRHASITGGFLRTGEGTAVTHHGFAFSRQRVVAGVAYAR